MPTTNEELVQKAIVTTDAIASSGKLNPAQANKFIDYVRDESVLKNNARVVRFRNESLDIDKIGVGSRVAMPATEAADPALRRGITTSKVSLAPKTIIVPFEISDEFDMTNIEGDSVKYDRVVVGVGDALAAQSGSGLGDHLGVGMVGEGLQLPGLADVPVLAELASEVAPGGAEREDGSAGKEVVERLLLDGIDAVSAGEAVAGENDGTAVIGPDKTEAPLPLLQFAEAGTKVALDPAIVQAMPELGSVEIAVCTPQLGKVRIRAHGRTR